MINLLEARSQGVMRSVAERDEVHMNINLRASSWAELEIIGWQEQWSLSKREAILERLKEIARIPWADQLANQMLNSWKEKCSAWEWKASAFIQKSERSGIACTGYWRIQISMTPAIYYRCSMMMGKKGLILDKQLL
jgi:hypothetical protein